MLRFARVIFFSDRELQSGLTVRRFSMGPRMRLLDKLPDQNDESTHRELQTVDALMHVLGRLEESMDMHGRDMARRRSTD